ncbi:MurR/RpiR family transcriptional regulator [Alicyclobacillus shizuokensis]|uniref:MurR/RpiR family transcriptional regulator n=1 Tax=Alicyclobacillus shizuokensis TaxID=392014 RepID=UPI0008368E55|nr:MurR/RpiR family transcriptional regulator [Alicyclobacillus shizuokensis]
MYIPGGGLVRLRESLSSLAESEARIAEYILSHPSEFLHLTVQELAQRSGGSTAAAVRLWKSLGFDGYQDFKLRVASDLQSHMHEPYRELTIGDSFASIVQSVHDSHIASIQNTLRLLKENDLHAAADVLMKSRHILCYGVGASSMVAADLAQKLTRIGLWAQAACDFHTAAVTAAALRPGDVLVAISDSGKTSDVVEVAQAAAGAGAHIIAITRFGDTPLSQIAHTRLYVNAVEPQPRVAATASRMAALVVVDTLFIYLVNQHQNEIYPVLEATRQAVQSHRLS